MKTEYRWHVERGDEGPKAVGPLFESALSAKEWRWVTRARRAEMKLFKRVPGGWEEVV